MDWYVPSKGLGWEIHDLRAYSDPKKGLKRPCYTTLLV